MNFSEWEPIYEAILEDFGYPREADERARDVLADLTEPFDLDGVPARDRPVAVVGAAPSLADELDRVREAETVFAASVAADVLREHDIGVDCMVTDLDKNPGTAVDLTREGTPVAVHAHGDNVEAVREWVPEMRIESVLPTTQAAPVDHVRNVGGFTDGDRAAYLADHLGASELVFPGWDFDDPSLDAAKVRKLDWAERLLLELERRRGERFAVLDGRREHVESLSFE